MRGTYGAMKRSSKASDASSIFHREHPPLIRLPPPSPRRGEGIHIGLARELKPSRNLPPLPSGERVGVRGTYGAMKRSSKASDASSLFHREHPPLIRLPPPSPRRGEGIHFRFGEGTQAFAQPAPSPQRGEGRGEGDLRSDEAKQQSERRFVDLPPRAPTPHPAAATFSPKGRRVLLGGAF